LPNLFHIIWGLVHRDSNRWDHQGIYKEPGYRYTWWWFSDRFM